MYRISHLENGLVVVTAEMPHMASASLGIWVGVGGRHEPAEVSGISHFIEHMLFKGTQRRSARQISQDVEGLGGYLNAFTSEETTCFYAKASRNHFEALLDVLMDMLLGSKFDPAEIGKERNVIKEEQAMYLDQPHQHVQELLNETLWPDHPLGRSLAGTEKTLDAMGRAEMLGYQRANYVSRATVIAAAGGVEHHQVVKLVSRFARRIPEGKVPAFAPAPQRQDEPRVRLFTKATEQTQVALGIRVCSRHDEKRFALRLLNAILGENMSSRLFQVVREDHGLAYSISSSLGFFQDAGVFSISSGIETEKLSKAWKLVARELRRAAETVPGAAELRRARDYVLGQLDLSLENTENHMMWIGEQFTGYGRIFTPEEVKTRLMQVRPSEVRAAAREFLRPERMSLALVSPLKSVRHLMPAFRW